MSRARIEVPQLENMVGAGKKKFVRYAEGASLYSLGLHTFQEIAKGPNGLQLRKERDNIAMKRKMDRKRKERD